MLIKISRKHRQTFNHNRKRAKEIQSICQMKEKKRQQQRSRERESIRDLKKMPVMKININKVKFFIKGSRY